MNKQESQITNARNDSQCPSAGVHKQRVNKGQIISTKQGTGEETWEVQNNQTEEKGGSGPTVNTVKAQRANSAPWELWGVTRSALRNLTKKGKE